MNFELRLKLERVARRIRSLRLWTALAFCWLLWAAIGMLAFELAGRFGWNVPLSWNRLALLAAVSTMVCALVVRRSAQDQRAVARRVEAKHPELNTLLLAAVEGAAVPREQLGYLQANVIRDAVDHSRSHNWGDSISAWRLAIARFAGFAALGLLAGVCIGLANQAGAHASLQSNAARSGGPSVGDFKIEVDPGNAEIERGTSLVIVAQFPAAVPPTATLIVSSGAGGQRSHEMARSLEDPKFVGRVAEVNEELTYRIEYARRYSDAYRITVFDYPDLLRADAKLEFPGYTSLEPATIEDVRQITAVEGTKLTLMCQLNKEVAEARLAESDGDDIQLRRDDKNHAKYRADWTLSASRRFKLQLVDHEGRKNRLPAEIVVNVVPNRPPRIVIDRPARDVEVSPLEELQLNATVTDDFRVDRGGVSYTLGGGEPREIVLPAGSSSAKKQSLAHVIDFEALRAEPDQLVSYFIWADDTGPDGKPRRTSSDMYFAEVRPFEEIYRQGQQPTEGEQQQNQQEQGGNSQEAGELAEMQKQIIAATWKLVRRETAAEPTNEFSKDTQLIEESQQAAIDRLSTLAERLEDAESLAYLETAQKHMSDALKNLSSANSERTAAPLTRALSAEQAAYQALLKLRAREFQVVRGGQQQRGQSAARQGNRTQRQLNQLELRADENRYETQSRATNPAETEAQRESREILDRLRDLARRQNDMNERLRELQSALAQAQTEGQREELERELKRLRDQQQEILRDTDALIGRMDRAESQQASQDARQQMKQTRSNVQQASEALQEGQLSQAVTEGTRAGRQLNELRDEFRRQSANRFTDEMTEMRRAARNLDDQQERLSNQLNDQNAEAGRSLRDTGARAEVREGLDEQKRQLGDLLQRMRQTVEESEASEPLLSKQLYDSVREAHQQRVENALDVARQLVEVGIERQAGEAMRAADQGIDRLREGIEQAAEGVLGDETEALRRARREVDRLADQLNREIDGAQGEQSPIGRQNQTQGDDSPNGNNAGDSPEGNESVDRPNDLRQRSQQDGRGPANEQSQNGEPDPDGQARAEQPNQNNQGGQNGGEDGPSREQQQNNESQAEGSRNGNREGPQRSSLRGSDGQDRGANQSGGRGGLDRLFDQNERGGRGGGGPRGPITGEDFRDWSDRLRDVEQMLDDAELRSEAARIRERAEDARRAYKRQSKTPDWSKLQDLVAEPLVELSRRIDEEIRRHESPDALVPIDRDPVPPEYAEQVRRYYERLGSGE